jgi:mannosyl-3-phosphoglycerate phosphatase
MRRTVFLVVFTDLDGTLLDHDTYSFEAAANALDVLSRKGIPVVISSSKTRAEIEQAQKEMRLRHPFISENGGGLFIPHGYFPFPLPGRRMPGGYHAIEFGRPYFEVVALLHSTAAEVGIPVTGFSDMSAEDVARECGLPLARAALAKQREYDEPFRILDPDPEARMRLCWALSLGKLRCTQGGRFHHVTGTTGKGRGVSMLRAMYERGVTHQILTVGLGDSLNDAPLLREVDLPVIVHNRAAGATDQLLKQVPCAHVTDAHGPRGWAEAIDDVIRAVG